MSWVGVWRIRNRESVRMWRVTRIKEEHGAMKKEKREPQADERGRDQERDKRYEMDVAERARREEEEWQQQKRMSPPSPTWTLRSWAEPDCVTPPQWFPPQQPPPWSPESAGACCLDTPAVATAARSQDRIVFAGYCCSCLTSGEKQLADCMVPSLKLHVWIRKESPSYRGLWAEDVGGWGVGQGDCHLVLDAESCSVDTRKIT